MDGQGGTHFVTVGQDSHLKMWTMPIDANDDDQQFDGQPCHSIPLNGVPHGVSHVVDSSDFVTCGEGISVWKVFRLVIKIGLF